MTIRHHWTIDGWIDMLVHKRFGIGIMPFGCGIEHSIVEGRHCVHVGRVVVIW